MSAEGAEVHVHIERLVVSGLSAAESRELVGELRAGLTAALSGRPAPAVRGGSRARARALGRTAAERVVRAAGRS